QSESRIKELTAEIAELQPKKALKDVAAADIKSLLESKNSFYVIAVDKHTPESDKEAARLKAEIQSLEAQMADAQAEADAVTTQLKSSQRERDRLEKAVTQAQSRLK